MKTGSSGRVGPLRTPPWRAWDDHHPSKPSPLSRSNSSSLRIQLLKQNYPFHCLKKRDLEGLYNHIVQNEVDFFRVDEEGNTLLHLACKHGVMSAEVILKAFDHKEVPQAEQKQLLNGLNQEGFTPLQIASISGDVATVQHLLKVGADPTVCNAEGRTAFELIKKSNEKEVKLCRQLLTPARRRRWWLCC